MIRVSDLAFSYGSSDTVWPGHSETRPRCRGAAPPNHFQLRVRELSIERGEKVAIVGPSGFGKSTLLKLLSGILAPQGGNILMGGVQLGHLSDAARRRFRALKIGMVFQELELIEYLSVRENILLPYLIHRSSRLMPEVQASVESLAAAMGLASNLTRRPNQLSQGERQRVAICRAMITQPDFLLVDEPTGSLDRETANEVLELLFDQAERNNTTMLIVTHDSSILNRFDRTVDVAELQDLNASTEEA